MSPCYFIVIYIYTKSKKNENVPAVATVIRIHLNSPCLPSTHWGRRRPALMSAGEAGVSRDRNKCRSHRAWRILLRPVKGLRLPARSRFGEGRAGQVEHSVFLFKNERPILYFSDNWNSNSSWRFWAFASANIFSTKAIASENAFCASDLERSVPDS